MSKPFYTSAAHQDLTEILNYISRHNPSAALKWVESVEAKCLLLAKSPFLGELQPHLGEDVRATTAGRYMIFYRVVATRIEILRIIPGGRDVTHLQ